MKFSGKMWLQIILKNTGLHSLSRKHIFYKIKGVKMTPPGFLGLHYLESEKT